MLILLLMLYHRKEYREMEAHLKNNNNPYLLKELGPKRAPGKSTMQRACAKVGISTLVKVNDAIRSLLLSTSRRV